MERQVWAEVVTIGSELVLGQLTDTNAAYIASKLSEIGVGLAFHTTVGDDREMMIQALKQALDRCRIVITTGGIGPTEDDLTREVAAELFGRKLVLRQDLLEYIEGLFRRMGYHMAENNKKQAYIPDGATPIHNPYGTAPGFMVEDSGRILICLPGVPHETEPLIRDEILPLLQKKFSPDGRVWVNRVLKVCGVGESNVDAQLKELFHSMKNPTIGLQAGSGEIKIRLTARADNQAQAIELLDKGEADIRAIIGPLIFGTGEETLPGNTVGILRDRGLTLAVGETVTRGVVTAELGRLLGKGQLRGALVLADPEPAEDMCRKLADQFDADIYLASSGVHQEDNLVRVDICAMNKNGASKLKTVTLGGPGRLVADRAAVMTTFTLWQLLGETG